jgi:hypothetical protein
MSKVPGYADTYVIVLETPRTGIDLHHQAWLTEYLYARTLSKTLYSWDLFFLKKKKKDKTWYIKWKSSFCDFCGKFCCLAKSTRRHCCFH